MNQIVENEERQETTDGVQAKVIAKVEEKVEPPKTEKNEAEKQEQKNNRIEAKPGRNKKIKIGIWIAIVLLFIVLVLSTIFSIINISNTKILKGITINHIKVEGLAKDEAVNLLKGEIQKNDKFVVKYNGKDYSIIKENLNIEYDFNKAVDEAYSQGRDNNIFVNNFNIAKNMIKGRNILFFFPNRESDGNARGKGCKNNAFVCWGERFKFNQCLSKNVRYP